MINFIIEALTGVLAIVVFYVVNLWKDIQVFNQNFKEVQKDMNELWHKQEQQSDDYYNLLYYLGLESHGSGYITPIKKVE